MAFGAQGTSRLSMDPRKLLMLLQGQQKQEQVRAKAAAEAAKVAQLRPDEQNDARLFGLDYVARNRARMDERTHDDMVRQQAEANRAAQAKLAAQARLDQDKAKLEEKQAAKDRIIKAILGKSPMSPGVGKYMPGGSMPNPLPGGGSINIPGMVGNAPPVRVLSEWEEHKLDEYGSAIPKGWQRKSDYDRQQQQAGKANADAKNAAELEEQRRAFAAFVADGGSSEEMARAQYLISTGAKPEAALRQVEASRSTKRRESLAARKQEEAAKEKKRIEEKGDKKTNRAETLKRYEAEELKKEADKWESSNAGKEGKAMPESYKQDAKIKAMDRLGSGAGPTSPDQDDALGAAQDAAKQMKADYDKALKSGNKAEADRILKLIKEQASLFGQSTTLKDRGAPLEGPPDFQLV